VWGSRGNGNNRRGVQLLVSTSVGVVPECTDDV
jgi:hypothetical protein